MEKRTDIAAQYNVGLRRVPPNKALEQTGGLLAVAGALVGHS